MNRRGRGGGGGLERERCSTITKQQTRNNISRKTETHLVLTEKGINKFSDSEVP